MANQALSVLFGWLLALSTSDLTSFGGAVADAGLGGGVFVQSLPELPTLRIGTYFVGEKLPIILTDRELCFANVNMMSIHVCIMCVHVHCMSYVPVCLCNVRRSV